VKKEGIRITKERRKKEWKKTKKKRQEPESCIERK
jgi:hypothetical protein